jgi:hypothetical protein
LRATGLAAADLAGAFAEEGLGAVATGRLAAAVDFFAAGFLGGVGLLAKVLLTSLSSWRLYTCFATALPRCPGFRARGL